MFDGAEWLNTLKGFGWNYVCRSGKKRCSTKKAIAFTLMIFVPDGRDPVCIHHVEFTDKRKHGLMSLRGGMPSVQSLYFGLLVLDSGRSTLRVS